ncbi:DNA-methyltransferase [Latilactobacillus sakei]
MKSLFDLLNIHDQDTLKYRSKELDISMTRLRYYSDNNIVPIGEDERKICSFLNISKVEYKLSLEDIDYGMLDLLKAHSKEVAKILNTDSGRQVEDSKGFDLINFNFKTEHGKLFEGDSLDLMKNMPDECVDMVFADPPFNLNVNYDSHINDKLNEDDYIRWTENWIKEAVRILKPGGSFFVWNLPKWNIPTANILDKHLKFRHWISVDMKYGMPIRGRLYPAHYALLYYIKGDRPNTFNPDRLPLEVCSNCGHELKNYGGYKNKLKSNGMTMSDVWKDIYPVRHTKYKTRKNNELPIKLLDRIISLSTNEGDIVFDPFGGSGTTYIVAELLDRKWIGGEIGPITDIVNRFNNLAFEDEKLNDIRKYKNKLFLPNIVKLREKNHFWLPKK